MSENRGFMLVAELSQIAKTAGWHFSVEGDSIRLRHQLWGEKVMNEKEFINWLLDKARSNNW
jgi:hypothetical protein